MDPNVKKDNPKKFENTKLNRADVDYIEKALILFFLENEILTEWNKPREVYCEMNIDELKAGFMYLVAPRPDLINPGMRSKFMKIK